jgi:hypothetical protein
MKCKKKKLISGFTPTNSCVVCGIKTIMNSDSTCGDPTCKFKAHVMFHQIIQETQGQIEGKCFA